MGRCSTALAVVLLLAASSPASAAASGSAWIIETLDVDYRFENDGTYTHVVRARLHVTTEDGRRTLGELYFPYYERSIRFELGYLRTIKPSGEVIEASPDELFEVAPRTGQRSPVFSDLEYKVIPVPGLQVGDRIEYEAVRRIFAPLVPGQFWGHHRLTNRVVVGRETVRLDLPAGRSIAFEMNPAVEHSVERRDGRRIHTWTHASPVARGPAGGFGGPLLFNLSTFRSWSDLGAWMNDLVAERSSPDEALTELARELVGDATDPREKVERLYTYVTQSVRYVRVAFGIGSYQPHAATDVARNLYGDCKDKHTLLAAMLDAVGIRSWPALVHASRPVDPDVPTPEAFDHVITVVALGDDRLWLDATEELTPFGWLAPSLRGGRALIVRPRGSRLETVPRVVPIPDARRALLKGTLGADGDLIAELRIEHSGSFEVGWRALFHQNRRSELEAALRLDRPTTLQRATSGEVTTSDPRDISGPFVVTYTLEQRDWLDPREADPELVVPSMILGTFARAASPTADLGLDDGGIANGDPLLPPVDDPLADGGLAGPFRLEERVELELPPGLSVTPPADVATRRDFASYEATYAVRDGVFEAVRTLEVADTALTPSQRDAVVSLVRSLQEDIGRSLAVRYAAPE